jgi:hypothetical protein
MEFVTGFQLIRKTDAELGALFQAFNQAIARKKPYTREWSDAVFWVDNLLGERKRRADAPLPRPS